MARVYDVSISVKTRLPNMPIDDLIAGYRRFRASTWQVESSRFEALSRLGQRPRALIIACSDSRTDPQMIFNARPGELFVVRNVANIVPPYSTDDQPHGISAAIEFAVRSLQVREIVILGHAMCGGVQALLNGVTGEVSDFVSQWVRIAEPARQRALKAPPKEQQRVCEHGTIFVSLENLLTFPWIEDAVEAGHATLHGLFFDIRSGILERLGEDGVFRPISD